MAVLGKRRMFNANLMKTRSFMELPDSAKVLYIYLGLDADDDGIVSAFPVMQSLGSTADNLKLLMTKGFILPLNDEDVIFISDWHLHNELDPKKKRDSMYRPLLEEKYPEYKKVLVTPYYKGNRNALEEPAVIIEVEDESLKEEVNASYKIEENKIKQNSLPLGEVEAVKKDVKNFEEDDTVSDHCYGKYQNLVLLPDEYEIVTKWKHYEELLDLVSSAIRSSDREYRSHFNLLKKEAKKRGWYVGQPIFGIQKNLRLTASEFTFLDRKYLEVERHLDNLADRLVGKEIDHPLAYIQKVAEMEGWQLRSKKEEAQYEMDLQSYHREQKAQKKTPIPEDLRKKIEEMRRQRK